MRCKIFFDNQVSDSKNEYYFSDEYVFYVISNYIYKNGSCRDLQIENMLKETFDVNINHSKFVQFLSKLKMEKDNYTISDKNLVNIKETKRFATDLLMNEWETESNLYRGLTEYIGIRPCNIAKGLGYSLAIDKQKTKLSDDYYCAKFYNIMNKYDQLYLEMDTATVNIDDSYLDLDVNIIFSDQSIIDMLTANGIYTMRELLSLSVDSLIILFSSDLEKYIAILESLYDEFASTYKDTILKLIQELKPTQKEVLIYRYGMLDGDFKSLEEVGTIFGLTRERIRQIEAKALLKFETKSYTLKNILVRLYYRLIKKNDKYILKQTIKDFVSNDLISGFIFVIASVCDSNIKYDEDLEVLYNTSLYSLEDISNEIMEVYGDVININDFDAFDDFEKKLILKNYRALNGICYLRKGLPERKISLYILDDYFTSGYHFSDEKDFNKFKEIYIKKYGKWDDNLTARLIGTYMDRDNYCQIDKGTYVNRLYTVKIPSELVDRIINFMLLNQPTVYYATIYEHFKTELNQLGINNYYYLKGLIDIELPADFNTKRNYVQIGETKMTAFDSLLGYIRSFNGKFSLGDLKIKFEGVKDYTLYNVLYYEINNGLIWLASKEFIYMNKVVITEDTKNELKSFIDNLFTTLNTKVISARKVYARLKLLNRGLLDKLKIVNDTFSMFSLIRNLYGDKYFYNRPLIAIEKEAEFNQETVIRDFVMKQDSFNNKTIKDFITKLSLRGLYSYLDFMEDLSDTFVQVGLDSMVKKETLGIDDNFLKQLTHTLNLIFTRFNELKLANFTGYSLLPKLERKWNKYLLVGIIRTYLNDNYEIENTDSTYDTTDFIIRKICQ